MERHSHALLPALLESVGHSKGEPARQGGLAASRISQDDKAAMLTAGLAQRQRLQRLAWKDEGAVSRLQGGHHRRGHEEVPACRPDVFDGKLSGLQDGLQLSLEDRRAWNRSKGWVRSALSATNTFSSGRESRP